MIVALADHPEARSGLFNLGSQSEEISMRDLALKIAKVLKRPIQIQELPETTGSPRRRCPDMTKTYACLGAQNETSLSEGILRTYEWYRERMFNHAATPSGA